MEPLADHVIAGNFDNFDQQILIIRLDTPKAGNKNARAMTQCRNVAVISQASPSPLPP